MFGRRGLASRSYRKQDVINVWPNVCLETIGLSSPGSLMRAATAHSMVTSSLFFVFNLLLFCQFIIIILNRSPQAEKGNKR
jgi:hypothetical protein